MGRNYFTEEHDEIRRQIRRFVNEEMKPIGDQCERDRIVPKSLFRKMGELGFLGIGLPERFGGTGEDIFGWMILGEEMGRSTYAGLGGVVTVHTVMAAPHLANAATEAQLEKYMPGVISGDKVCAIAISEEHAASDVGSMSTTARLENGEWVINGSKFWISNGVNADLYFVAARTDAGGKGANGISMFIVEKDTPGFRLGQKIEKMGFRSSDTAELLFDDCRIPQENLLGVEGRGFYSLMKNLQNERLVLAAVNVGEAIAALSLTLDYVTQRKTFGVPLIERQVIRQRLAMLHARVEAGRQLLYHTADLVARGEEHVREASMVKAYWGELANELMYACVQYHGGAGFMEGSTIERMYRDARLYSIGGGATEIMLEEVAKRWNSTPDWRE